VPRHQVLVDFVMLPGGVLMTSLSERWRNTSRAFRVLLLLLLATLLLLLCALVFLQFLWDYFRPTPTPTPTPTTPPLATVGFGSATYMVDEGEATATITVTLSVTSELTISVDYEASDGTATDGEDYTATSGTLTFDPGVASQTFTVAILDDTVEEGDETVTLTLSNADNATISLGEATLTIVDDDCKPVTVGFRNKSYEFREDAGTASIVVDLDQVSEKCSVEVDYATGDGTAKADEDYTPASDRLTFSPGITSQTFLVFLTNDEVAEAVTEAVRLTLSNPSNNASIGLGEATLIIVDDEPTATVTITPTPPVTPTVITPTPTPTLTRVITNVLRNGNFEEGFQPNQLGNYWNSFNNGDAHFSFHIDDWPLVVVEGKHTQLIEIAEATRSDRYLGIYQTVSVIPGEVYTFSMRGLIRTNTGDVEKTSYGYRLQVGFDPAGGQDWNKVENWVELPWDEQLRVQDSFRFDSYTTTVIPTGESLTVFIRAWKKWADAGEGDYDVDDIRLVGPVMVTPPVPGIPVTGEAPPTLWDNVRVWATIALLLLLLGGALWRFGWKRT